MKRLQIPECEKNKGMMWVTYPVVKESFKIVAEAELQIQQGKN